MVVGKDAGDLHRFDLTHVLSEVESLLLVNNEGRRDGYGEIGNYALETCRTEVLGIVHADTIFGPGSLRSLTQVAADGVLAGIVGRSLTGAYHWCNGGEAGPGKVSTLDSCALFVRPDLGLRFDTLTFPAFHCCVEDFCLQAACQGLSVMVPLADAKHQGQNTFHLDWQLEYRHYRAILEQKWQDFPFLTT